MFLGTDLNYNQMRMTLVGRASTGRTLTDTRGSSIEHWPYLGLIAQREVL